MFWVTFRDKAVINLIGQIGRRPIGRYLPFVLEDYVDNLAALARMKAHITQKELARRLGVTQAYISKIERQEKVTPQLLARIKAALKN